LKVYKSDQIRNIATGAHGGAGKTSLVEAMLFNMNEINRIGSVELGTTISDYNEEEMERQISLGTSLLHGEWNNHKVNMVDTPGYTDFFGEVVGALRAVDSVLVVISATGGVERGVAAGGSGSGEPWHWRAGAALPQTRRCPPDAAGHAANQ